MSVRRSCTNGSTCESWKRSGRTSKTPTRNIFLKSQSALRVRHTYPHWRTSRRNLLFPAQYRVLRRMRRARLLQGRLRSVPPLLSMSLRRMLFRLPAFHPPSVHLFRLSPQVQVLRHLQRPRSHRSRPRSWMALPLEVALWTARSRCSSSRHRRRLCRLQLPHQDGARLVSHLHLSHRPPFLNQHHRSLQTRSPRQPLVRPQRLSLVHQHLILSRRQRLSRPRVRPLGTDAQTPSRAHPTTA